MDINQAKKLLQRYREGIASPAEKELVNQWYDQLIESGEWEWDEGERATMEQMMQANLLQRINESELTTTMSVRNLFWRRIAIAASIIAVVGLSSYFFFNKQARQDAIVKTEPAKDIEAPKVSRAMITLSNNQRVYLNSAVNVTLAMQGNVQLVKLANGQIAYKSQSGEIITEIQYNTLDNPRGSKVIDMTLADGSRVWLNAGSSVTYPVAFVGNERKVTITGEAYFEVAHNEAKPFYVSKGKMEVKVLGTHFNVNAYDDETDIKVTLLEGSVKVGNNRVAVTIKPGEQVRLTSNQPPITGNPDLEAVMAWKNGEFQFGDRIDIQTIMRQLARWYNVEVEYKGTVNSYIGGSISRNVNLSNVLQMLEKTSEVKFKVEGNKVIVLP